MTNDDKVDHPMLPHVRIAVTLMTTLLILVMLVLSADTEEQTSIEESRAKRSWDEVEAILLLRAAKEPTFVEKLRTVEDVQDQLHTVEDLIRKIGLAEDKTEEQSENLQKLHRMRELLQELLRVKIEGLTAKAKQGDAWAQLKLGAMYDAGKVVPQDPKQAVYWYRKAAEQGDIAPADVQFFLLAMALRGNTDARDWMAERGHATVQFDLGGFYYRDDSVFKDHRQAVYWYRKSAEQGYARAQAMLGVMYMVGSGVPEDYVQAYAWFNLAAAQGIEQGEEGKAILREQLTPAQVAEAQALSRKLTARIEAGR